MLLMLTPLSPLPLPPYAMHVEFRSWLLEYQEQTLPLILQLPQYHELVLTGLDREMKYLRTIYQLIAQE